MPYTVSEQKKEQIIRKSGILDFFQKWKVWKMLVVWMFRYSNAK